MGDYPYTGFGQPGNADPDHPYTHLIRFINYISPDGRTSTGPAMWEAYDYFKQQDDHNYANDFDLAPGTYKDPQYFCAYDHTNCTAVPCAKNFVILASDGQWNTPSCSIDTGYEDNSADPVVPAYRMHHDVLRTLNGADIRVQQVYALGLFLGGTGEQSLKNVAMYGSFDLNHGDWPDDLTGYPQDTCRMDDCCSEPNCGKGSACTPLPSSSPDWDQNGDGQPDTFLKASTAIQIKNYLLRFLRSILARASAGTSVSAQTQKREVGVNLIQAVFYPKVPESDLTWAGFVNVFWLYAFGTNRNIREDTVENKILDLCSPTGEPGGDYILHFVVENATGETTIKAYESACNGTEASRTPKETYLHLNTLTGENSPVKVWEAGRKLSQTRADERKIYTPAALNSLFPETPVDLTNATYELVDLSQRDYSLLGDEDKDGYVDENGESFRGVTFSENGLAVVDLIDYIYGKDQPGWRNRTFTVGTENRTWKLGDIVYSTPLVVDYPGYSVVYVGANDGLLHAFRLGKKRYDGLGKGQLARICDDTNILCTTNRLGEELWAFAPKNALPYLRYLADPGYCHLYYVDLEPFLYPVDRNRDGRPEKLILIGGMRLGGAVGCDNATNCVIPPEDTCPSPGRYSPDSNSCVGLSSYFALDVTDPEDPKFLWEFADPDLGFTLSGPALIYYQGTPFVMFLSGPTSYNGSAALPPRAFVLELDPDNYTVAYTEDINPKPKIYEIDLNSPLGLSSSTKGFGGRLFTSGLDYNEDGNTDLVPFGLTYWDNSTQSWKGIVAAAVVNSSNSLEWTFQVYKTDIGPVTTRVLAGKCKGAPWIYYATGRWFYKEDPSGEGRETLGGIKLDPTNNWAASTELNGEWSVTLDLGETVGGITYGKERSITDPLFKDNISLFVTMEPTADVCGFGGRTRVLAMECDNGSSITRAVGTLFLQLSRGNIEKIEIKPENFPLKGGRATRWFVGTPSPSPPLLVSPGEGLRGRIIYWFEK
ncbi:pilus assembly protein [Thermosulfurimonas sp. F29]|uniref:pilus assembly protein n=1 Tax=Thermosulfurimonas sp. F29 TaxID=2867247 RepID=UPI001C83EE09|nr:hypothetical protein [Thermosulfurimonas sp. F29]MBX6423042.1 hypothetical protein [Thermosulfurimonas sp. F29]